MNIDLDPACPKPTHPRVCSGHAFNAPTLNSASSGRYLSAPDFLGLQGRQALHPLPTGRRSGQFGTLLGATGGYPNTLAPNGGKLGRLRCARQGLVRVPESNTKYGGNRGITGGNAAPVMPPSISESSGIPKEKKLCGQPPSMLPPAVHRADFYSSHRLALARLTGGYGEVWLACRRPRGVAGPSAARCGGFLDSLPSTP